MKIFTQTMLDQPGEQAVGGAAAYGLFSYVLIPFVLYWVSFGFHGDSGFRVVGQIAHYGINFVVILGLFREYLQDAFLTVQMNTAEVVRTVARSAIVILAFSMLLWNVPAQDNSFVTFMMLGTLPIGEVDLLMFTGELIYLSPILGSLVLILLSPITTSCIYYAVGFAPVCYKKPWLAYVVVAVILAIPRAINSFLFWPLEQEMAIYLGQLPIHLIACRAYQKCDTIWAPIFCLMVANLYACVYLELPTLLMGLLGR